MNPKKIKTQDLIGPALDWAVDEAQGYGGVYLKWWNEGGDKRFTHCQIMRAYSTDWSQGGPIIERERIQIDFTNLNGDDHCRADGFGYPSACAAYGPTTLIAAMRCYVASKLGDEVDVPEELL